MLNFGPLRLRSVRLFGAPQQISAGFASWLRYCSDIAHWRPTKFARCLAVSWATTPCIHFRELLPLTKFCQVQNSLCVRVLHSPILAAAASVTGRHLNKGRQPNFASFSRGRRLYLAGRPSRWASAHILGLIEIL